MSRNRRPLATEKFDYVQRHYRKRKAEAARAQAGPSQKGELYLSADVRKLDNNKSSLKVIEEAGWDAYDICIWRLIEDRRRLRQGM